jgi:hypothetical protein
VHTALPVVKLGEGASIGITEKYKSEMSLTNGFSSYLKLARDIFYLSYLANGSTDERLFALTNAVGNFLDTNEASSKTESTTGITGEAYMLGTLDVDFGNKDGVKAEVKGSGKVALEFGDGSEYNSTAQNHYTYSNFMSLTGEGKIEMGVGYESPGGEKYGAGAKVGQVSNIRLERKSASFSSGIDKGSISVKRSAEVEVDLSFPDIPTVEILASKEYGYKYSLGKSLFEHAGSFPIDNPVWSYLNNRKDIRIPRGDHIDNHLNAIGSGLQAGWLTGGDELKQAMNKTFSRTIDKTYSAGIGLSKEINLGHAWLGMEYTFTLEGSLVMENTYPLAEEYYHFGTNTLLPVVEYADLDKAGYWFSPHDSFADYWNEIANAVTSKWDDIVDKAKEFWNNITEWLTPEDQEGKRLVNRDRTYASQLKSYAMLRSAPQTDISTIEIFIPVHEEAFAYNTRVEYDYYYPGGEVLGATIETDTFVIISDIVFLSAYHGTDTLSVAPYGDFTVHEKTGSDDLSFLGVTADHPVSVYHKPLGAELWQEIGTVDQDIEIRTLGTYVLGVSITVDRESPVVHISKDEPGQKVAITVTDNMAVYWKSVSVFVNGLKADYTRNQSSLSVELSGSELANDLYVTVYASDLARNETVSTREFAALGISVSLNKTVLTLPVNGTEQLQATVTPPRRRQPVRKLEQQRHRHSDGERRRSSDGHGNRYGHNHRYDRRRRANGHLRSDGCSG